LPAAGQGDVTAAVAQAPVSEPGKGKPGQGRLQLYFWLLAVASLASILLFSYCLFAGYLAYDAVFFTIGQYKVDYFRYLTLATAVYFLAGVIWINLREKARAAAGHGSAAASDPAAADREENGPQDPRAES